MAGVAWTRGSVGMCPVSGIESHCVELVWMKWCGDVGVYGVTGVVFSVVQWVRGRESTSERRYHP